MKDEMPTSASQDIQRFWSNHPIEPILNLSPFLVCYLDADSVYRYVNQSYAEYWGMDRDEMIGRLVYDIIPADRTERFQPLFARALQGESFESEFESPASGRLRYFRAQFHPDRDATGKVVGVFMFTSDITELKRVKERLDLAVKGSMLGVWETDPSDPGWMFTGHIEVLLGLEPGSLENSFDKAFGRIHPEHLDAVTAAYRTVVEQGQEANVEFQALTARDGYHWMRASARPEKNPDDGTIRRVVGTISDIDQIKQAQIRADEEVQQRDMFLAMLAHELRNPMTAINNAVYYAKQSGEVPDSLTQIFDIIDRQSRQMSRLMEDLLDLSRLTRNRLQFRFAQVDLRRILENAATDYWGKFEAKQQRLQLDLGAQPLIVYGDEGRLSQAVTNLLDNANKYTPDGGAVSLTVAADDQEVHVSVSDTGQGIPVENQERIFELFFQNEQPLHRSAGGLGVGLFLVRRIIESHGGTIGVSSPGTGQGCTITFSIPRSSDSERGNRDAGNRRDA